MANDTYTYNDFLHFLQGLSEEQREQSVQLSFPSILVGDPEKLHSVIAVDSVAALGIENTKSTEDFQHHPEQIVLLCDWNPFTSKGDTLITWKDRKCEFCGEDYTAEIGDKTGVDYSGHDCRSTKRRLKFELNVEFPPEIVLSNFALENKLNDRLCSEFVASSIGANSVDFWLLHSFDNKEV